MGTAIHHIYVIRSQGGTVAGKATVLSESAFDLPTRSHERGSPVLKALELPDRVCHFDYLVLETGDNVLPRVMFELR